MKIAIGTDHAGYGIKQAVIEAVEEAGHTAIDLGVDEPTRVDYPDFGRLVGEAILSGKVDRGIAICAPIAPYEYTRREIRKVIEVYGGFFEVHVSTPIDECERRDRKGMYAKARAGLIKGFTGVDDPYEAPVNPELRIDTSDMTPVEAAQEILLFLGKKGYI